MRKSIYSCIRPNQEILVRMQLYLQKVLSIIYANDRTSGTPTSTIRHYTKHSRDSTVPLQ